MKLIYKTSLILITLVAAFTFIAPAEAQAACSITSGTFRTIETNTINGWYEDDLAQRPFAYLDFVTNGECQDQTVNIKVRASDNNGADGTALTVTNLPIISTNFTIHARTNEFDCENSSPNCEFYIETQDATTGSSWNNWGIVGETLSGAGLAFNCDGGCSSIAWTYLGAIEYQSVSPNDPDTPQEDGETDEDLEEGGTDEVEEGGVDNDTQEWYTFNSPLTNTPSVYELIASLLNFLIKLGIPVLVLAIVYSGFLFVKSQGKPEELETAKKVLLYTLIGGAVLLGAWVIVTALQGTINVILDT